MVSVDQLVLSSVKVLNVSIRTNFTTGLRKFQSFIIPYQLLLCLATERHFHSFYLFFSGLSGAQECWSKCLRQRVTASVQCKQTNSKKCQTISGLGRQQWPFMIPWIMQTGNILLRSKKRKKIKSNCLERKKRCKILARQTAVEMQIILCLFTHWA